jgi:release factor H-coupled RctB family protein
MAPHGDGVANLFSLAHGAGRRWKRGEARGRLLRRYGPAELKRTRFGGHVICDDRELLYDEAPEAYKDVETVVRDLADAGMLEVIAVLRPLITYKKGTP